MTRVLDVSHLPDGTADSRALLWWGNVGMLVIEGTMFAMAFGTWLYLKTVNLDWPPATVPKPNLVLPTAGALLLLVSLIANVMTDRAAKRDNLSQLRVCMSLLVLTSVIFLALRASSIAQIGFKWSDHAYGSIVWAIVFLHTIHVLAAGGEYFVMLLYSFVGGPFGKHQLLDVRCTVVYWYFVALVWLPFYALIYIAPWFVRKG